MQHTDWQRAAEKEEEKLHLTSTAPLSSGPGPIALSRVIFVFSPTSTGCGIFVQHFTVRTVCLYCGLHFLKIKKNVRDEARFWFFSPLPNAHSTSGMEKWVCSKF